MTELKEWQERKEFTIAQAANFFGVSKSTYEKWLYQQNPCPTHILKLIQLDELLGKRKHNEK